MVQIISEKYRIINILARATLSLKKGQRQVLTTRNDMFQGGHGVSTVARVQPGVLKLFYSPGYTRATVLYYLVGTNAYKLPMNFYLRLINALQKYHFHQDQDKNIFVRQQIKCCLKLFGSLQHLVFPAM